VGGCRAGETAAKWAKEVGHGKIVSDQVNLLKESIFLPLQRSGGISPDRIYDSVNKLVTPWAASIFKHERRINKVLAGIKAIADDALPSVKAGDIHELVKAAEARNYVQLMQVYNVAALERKESRMVHYREDYPYTDEQDWRKLVLLSSDGKGNINVRIEPVSLGCSAILPDRLVKKPVVVAHKMEKQAGGWR
jgi:succinate dehydrogenase/fumarate reductase flavoprotein subunit